MPLLTAAQAADIAFPELVSTGLDTGMQARLEAWIARGQSALARWLWYPTPSTGARANLESSTYIQYLRGNPDKPRHLDTHFSHGRLVSVTSVYDDPSLDWGADTLVDSGDYNLIQPDGVILLTSTSAHGAWGITADSIKLTHVGGWTSSTVPYEVQEALGLLCGHYARLKAEQGHGSVSASGASVATIAEDMPAQVAELMAPYRMLGRGWA